ncbi:MAG TPA: hypothetical protein DDW71_04240 [Lactobacillus sp.]|nr:hypothetical protein [Lactobacillus sp.]
MALNRQNKIRNYSVTSAVDTIKETLSYRHLSVDWLADMLHMDHEEMNKVLKRENYLTIVQLKQVQSLIGVSAQLLRKLDSNFLEYHLTPAELTKIEELEQNSTDADFENIDDLDWDKL